MKRKSRTANALASNGDGRSRLQLTRLAGAVAGSLGRARVFMKTSKRWFRLRDECHCGSGDTCGHCCFRSDLGQCALILAFTVALIVLPTGWRP